MSEEIYSKDSYVKQDSSFRDLVDKYFKYWPWFLGCLLLSVAVAFIYLKFTVPTYRAVASIIIKDEENSSNADMSLYSELGLLNGMGTNSIANEIGLLRSKRLMANTVKALKLNVQYFDPEDFLLKELYNDSPIQLDVLELDEKLVNRAEKAEENVFEIQVLDGNNIRIYDPVTEKSFDSKIGTTINMEYITFKVIENPNSSFAFENSEMPRVLIKCKGTAGMIGSYKSKLTVELIDEKSTLIELGIVDPVKSKAEDILNELVYQYNQEAIDDKNLVAQNTASFINERLKIINKELDSVEVGKEIFKETNRLTNIEAESALILENASEYSNKRQDVNTQLGLVNEMIKYLDQEETNLLPTNLGIEESSINSIIDRFNNLVLQRNRVLAGSTEINPIVIKLNSQIDQLKKNVKQSLLRKRSSLQIAQNDLRARSGAIGSQISEVPSQERLFRGIERQQDVKETLYLFLLQKREENSLSLAATAPKAKIVDQAYSVGAPVSPNPKIILFVSVLAGFIVPFLIINLIFLLDNKIQNKEDVERNISGIPVVGELPHIAKSESNLVKENDRSMLSETFRLLLSNLYYLEGDQKNRENGYCIFVTSSVKGEGKTFTAANIALMLAIKGKKTILLGADLRNPQLHQYEPGAKTTNGISNYLASDELLLNLIKDSTLHPNLKILSSGPIPPNPAELLGKEKVENLFMELREQFEYIIVDTAPSMILVDTFLINKYADLTLYLVRAGYTEKKLLDLPMDAKEKGKLKNMGLVINDIKLKDFGYGKKYGYVYGEESPKKSRLFF